MRVYLAGPLGFSEAGKSFHKEKIVSVLTALNYDILDPWELTPASATAPILQMPYGEPKRAAWEALNPLIGKTNADAIKACDLVFAVLDGTDVDSGTASEIGYAFAFDKQILGYRGDFRLSADNEGSTVNLQVEYFIRQSGGKIIRTIEELPAALAGLGGSGPGANAVGQQEVRPQRAAIAATDTAARPAFQPTGGGKTSETGGAKLIIGILLALIVRAALEAIFKDPLQDDAVEWPPLIVWFQLLIFSLMMARFYLGATRYIDTQPPSLPLWVSSGNVVFASALFCTFYVAGLAVGEEEFYPVLFAMHIVDACWFAFGFAAQRYLQPPEQPGEIKPASQRMIMTIFFWLSIVTIVLAIALFAAVQFGKIDAFTAKSLFLIGLTGLSIFDFIKLREYYFRHSNWIAQNTA